MFSDTDKTRLIEAMRRTGTRRLEIWSEAEALTLDVTPHAPSAAPPHSPERARTLAKSPAMGRFLACGSDDGLAAVAPGDWVTAHQVLGYVDNDGARVPVTAPQAGTLIGALPQNTQLVGFGDPLFTLETQG